MSQEVYVANETFACEVEGENLIVHKGITRVRSGHPLYEQHAGAFDRVGDDVTFDIEEATAPPTPPPPSAKSQPTATNKK